jgi:hypothetical protein
MIKEISLKAKHIYYIATYVQNLSVTGMFDTIYEFKNKLKSQNPSDEDLVVLNVDLNTVFSIYSIIGGVGHIQAKHINTEMSDILMPQLMAIKSQAESVFSNDPENGDALADLEIIDKFFQLEIDAAAAINDKISIGKAWLLS